MEHSVAQAIRAMTAKICRRLDVLIDAAGKPPVEDVEGTPAPRRPLAPSAAKKNMETPVPPVVSKKRGRPPKKSAADTSPTTATIADSSSSDEQKTPENTAEVISIIFFVLCFIDTCQVFYCPEHDLYSLVHGEQKYMKEIYTRSEMLKFDVTEQELAAAKTGITKCICFPWVRTLCVF